MNAQTHDFTRETIAEDRVASARRGEVVTAAEQRELGAPQVSPGSATIISVIERAAANPDIDVNKVADLLAMHERVMARESELAFNDAMRAAQAEMPQVVRKAKNAQTNSKYAKLESVSEAMTPVITKHGFSMSFGSDVSPLEGHYRVTCRVSHAAGHSRDYHADVPSDLTGMKGQQNKTATHAFGSTMSYGRRYLKLLVFDVATRDDDDGRTAGQGPVITADQVDDLVALIEETQADKGRFLQYMGVDRLADIPAAQLQKALTALQAKRGR